MTGIFQDVKITWGEVEYTIPAEKVMGAIATIEEKMTLYELAEASQKSKVRLTQIAAAFGAVLRYAGAPVTDEEVYAGLFSRSKTGMIAQNVVLSLLVMMSPPGVGQGAPAGKEKEESKDEVKSSRSRTKRR